MKIFLEAFIDTNFGDNLFVHILASKYPDHTFYMIIREGYEKSYKILCENEKNIYLIEKPLEQSFLSEMDAMLIVGGDMFGNEAEYSTLINQMRTIKKSGGFTAILGTSLFSHYSKITWLDLMALFSFADVIVVREQETYRQIKKKMPWVSVKAAADMAFLTDVSETVKKIPQKGVLGISIRRKNSINLNDSYVQYCEYMAETIVTHLDAYEENQVLLLALSAGVFDDAKVANDIKMLCPEKYHKRIRCESFQGIVESYIEIIQQCDQLICTRFHALVFALILKKNFVPIIYEEKMERLLNEIKYSGIRLYYEREWNPNILLNSFLSNTYSESAMNDYLQKVNTFFVELDRKMNDQKGSSRYRGRIFYILYLVIRQCFQLSRKIKIAIKGIGRAKDEN